MIGVGLFVRGSLLASAFVVMEYAGPIGVVVALVVVLLVLYLIASRFMNTAAIAVCSALLIATFMQWQEAQSVPNPMPPSYAGPWAPHCPGFQGCLHGEGNH